MTVCLCTSGRAADIAYPRPGQPDRTIVSSAEENLRVIFPRIYDCDACLIRCEGETLLLDCGDEKQTRAIMDMLEEENVWSIDHIIITHPHHDHIGALRDICEEYEVGNIWISFPEYTNAYMQTIASVARQYAVPICHYADEDIWMIGNAMLQVYIKSEATQNVNNRSGLFRLSFGECVMTFASDLELQGLLDTASKVPAEKLKTDILKYPHHGKDPMPGAYYEQADPGLIIVTAYYTGRKGEKNIAVHHWPVLYTYDGVWSCETDGVNWQITDLRKNKSRES